MINNPGDGDLAMAPPREFATLSRRLSPTIYDVATAAGVAPSTVSRAFSRPGRVNPETVEHVRAVAVAIGYERRERLLRGPPNSLAMIGVLVSDVTDPVSAEVICGAESAAAEASYAMLLTRCRGLAGGGTQALDSLLGNVEGVVLANARVAESVVAAIGERVPLVVLDRARTGVPSVVTNQSRGAQLAMEHLSRLGHHSISYLAGPDKWSDTVRWQALQGAAGELRVNLRRLGPFVPTLGGGCQVVAELVRSRSSAVIAANDHLALEMIHQLTAAGRRVPDDVSVVGFDDIPAARLMSPSLTTIAAPHRAQGVVAVHHLLSMIKGTRAHRPEATVLPVQLIARESSAWWGGHLRRSPPPGSSRHDRLAGSLVTDRNRSIEAPSSA